MRTPKTHALCNEYIKIHALCNEYIKIHAFCNEYMKMHALCNEYIHVHVKCMPQKMFSYAGERLTDAETDEIMQDTDTTPDLEGNLKYEGKHTRACASSHIVQVCATISVMCKLHFQRYVLFNTVQGPKLL